MERSQSLSILNVTKRRMEECSNLGDSKSSFGTRNVTRSGVIQVTMLLFLALCGRSNAFLVPSSPEKALSSPSSFAPRSTVWTSNVKTMMPRRMSLLLSTKIGKKQTSANTPDQIKRTRTSRTNSKSTNFSTQVPSTFHVETASKPRVAPLMSSDSSIRRRKSPALWRTQYHTDYKNDRISSGMSVDAKQQQRKHPHPLPAAKPEVMAPCGGFPQLHAAIANGADSVYLGLSAFSARARAANFNSTELVEAVELAHASNVRVYVALNTLVFQNELEEVTEWIIKCVEADVDALIVQDVGVCHLVQHVLDLYEQENGTRPRLELHGSTQQTITTTAGVMFAHQQLGATRVVVGREVSIRDMESMAKEMSTFDIPQNVELEAFVHGALCVSYSGQCFSSEAWGGRSANRGQCAQACRLPYGLIVNGKLKDLEDMSYLLSPQDLCGLDHVDALVRTGIQCLKIEGRLKDQFYVAATTRAYRDAVDAAWNKLQEDFQDDLSSELVTTSSSSNDSDEVTKHDLAQLFARGQDENHDGLSSGFLIGSQHQNLVRGRSPRHRGIHIGRVLEGSYYKGGLWIELDERRSNEKETLQRGDGIVIDRGMPQQDELGGPIYDVDYHYYPDDGNVNCRRTVARVRFGRAVERKWKQLEQEERKSSLNANDNASLLAPVGAHVWKTSDPRVNKKIQRLIPKIAPSSKLKEAYDSRNRGVNNDAVRVRVSGSLESPLRIEIEHVATGCIGIGDSTAQGLLSVASDETGNSAFAERESSSSVPSEGQEQEQRDRQVQAILKAIGTFGNTPWTIDAQPGPTNGIDFGGLDVGTWCPISWVKKARQQAVADLMVRLKAQRDDQLQQENLNSKSLSQSTFAKKQKTKLNPRVISTQIIAGSNRRRVSMLNASWNQGNQHQGVGERSSPSSTAAPEATDATPGEEYHPSDRNDTNLGARTKLSVLARTPEQIHTLCDWILRNSSGDHGSPQRRLDEIIIDFLEVTGMQQAVDQVRSLNEKLRRLGDSADSKPIRIVVATPRIIKVGEDGIWKSLLELETDGLLVRSAGLLHTFQTLGGTGSTISITKTKHSDNDESSTSTTMVKIPELIGDFSLNVVNTLSAGEYLQFGGLSRITASYDLSSKAISELAKCMHVNRRHKQQEADESNLCYSDHQRTQLEVIAYAHVPIFHTEHCVFARFLSKGNSYLDCGHVCTRNTVHLRESLASSNGADDHVVLADMGCRNTVFSAQAQSGVYSLQEWSRAGVDRVRIELVDERPHDVNTILNGYESVLGGSAKPSTVWNQLESIQDGNGRIVGISLGSLRNVVERRAGEL